MCHQRREVAFRIRPAGHRDAATGYKKIAEKSFRRLSGYELVPHVAEGVEVMGGIEALEAARSYAA